MDSSTLNARIVERGRALFAAVAGERPSLFDQRSWTGRVMEWSLAHERFKVQLFRFVDVFPTLSTPQLLNDHIRDYFGSGEDLPPVLARGARVAGRFGSLGGEALSLLISANIRQMARQFIVGETVAELLASLERLRREGFGAVVDVLGEATLSEAEAEAYGATYRELLDSLDRAQAGWPALGSGRGEAGPDWGCAPRVNVAVKPSALYCLASPQDFEGSVNAILARLHPIAARVVAAGGFLCIDMESYRLKAITLELYRRLRREFRDYPHMGIALQSYLKDTDSDLAELLGWARQEHIPISIRLVKGAYWDYETVRARQQGWESPVWGRKAETDAAFERQARAILENHAICHFGCGSHNIRTIAAVLETAAALGVPESRYEFQMLYGMAEPVRRGILKAAGRVRLYCPYGAMVPGMGYLVRRLLENTANESFLRRSFAEGTEIERLLEDPAATAGREQAEQARTAPPSEGVPGSPRPFANEPAIDFTRTDQRAAFPRAITAIRSRLGREYPLFIGGREVTTADWLPSVNPARPSEVLGRVCQAGTREVGQAMDAARDAFPAWRATPPRERAGYLFTAARLLRERIFEFAAWQVLEIGKQWDQAHADVAEAVDFLEYYGAEMIRLGEPRRLGHIPGEVNHHLYGPRGVAAVIAPWNFPLAISTGMAATALVTGNPVLFKPSSLTAIIGHQMVELFREAGLPAGVFNYLPGRSSVMGDFLVDHPDVALIAFTGSMEVGLRIIDRAARVHPGQATVKRVIAEMGGKNAIIIDADADLDEAVGQVLASAFAFQGQKCSACSRVIVLDAIHDRFVERLVEAARAWRIGPADDPSFAMGAVADDAAQRKILEYIAIGEQEGTLLYKSPVPGGEGYWAPLTIIGAITPAHRLAREEVFGPVLAVMRVRDFDQAIQWANATPYALTGGLFSRSPRNIEHARTAFRVGNLYINRGITGALVGRQPFGGAAMSGVGTKAGGPDYLLHFMDPRVVTENTMRRGFTPSEG